LERRDAPVKKLVLFVGVVLAAVALIAAGCGGEDEEPSPPAAGTEQAPEFQTIEAGVLTVGSDIPFPPFEFREGGELTGFDVELVEELASRLNLEVNWVDTAFDTIFTQLAAGRFDVVASATTITPERDEQINFTDPYYLAQQALTVNTEETPDIGSVDDLDEGDVVAVQAGTTGEAWARENLEPEGARIRSFPEAGDTYTALEAGSVTGVFFDEPSAISEAEARPALEVVEKIDTGEQYGFGVDPNNQELLEVLNGVLQEIKDDGTYEEIYGRFGDLPPGGNIVATAS
jgi:polar amino acid transport system substrate-binding protein